MNHIPKNLKEIGLNKRILESANAENPDEFDIARVVAIHRESYTISDGKVDVIAELMGKFIFNASSPVDFPAVGDWVLVSFHDKHTFAVIHKILSRTSLLKRKTSGKRTDFQLIASNIDTAFIVESLNENFNLNRLERYLVMVNESNIQPVVLLSKSDLLTIGEIEGRIGEIKKRMPLLKVVPFSNENESGLISVKEMIQPNLTYCLLGSSGVGKTTLINNLIGESIYKTRAVREKDCRGRHTTTHRQLIKLNSGAMIVDTPGMRELGNFSVNTGFDETFGEIVSLSQKCRFNDCSHTGEKGCAILDALENGELTADRYQNYMKMKKELAYNEMSYLEKKRKDKQFGKYCRTVMKYKKIKK